MNIENFLKEKNIVRNKKQANIIMIAFVFICLVMIVIISRKDKSYLQNNDDSQLSKAELELIKLSDKDLENIDINPDEI